MKKTLLIAGLLAVAALDWAALHDILKHNEPSYFAEYTMLVASAVIFTASAAHWFRKRASTH